MLPTKDLGLGLGHVVTVAVVAIQLDAHNVTTTTFVPWDFITKYKSKCLLLSESNVVTRKI